MVLPSLPTSSTRPLAPAPAEEPSSTIAGWLPLAAKLSSLVASIVPDDATLQFGQPLFPQVVEVHGVENEFCPRAEAPEQGDVMGGHVVPAYEHKIEIAPPLAQESA